MSDHNVQSEPSKQFTRQFCEFLAPLRYEDMPQRAAHEARRGVLDWLGCALAASSHPTIDLLVGVLQEVSGKPVVSVLGRKLKLGLLDGALANGQMGHVLDYDDTHLAETTVLHTSSPTLSALFSLAEHRPVSGPSLLLAYAAGFEGGVRTGLAAPGHLEGGWHLTGTLGTIAAGVAAGKLLGLNARQLMHAMAISATQSAGMQQNRGTMCKSFHAGKGAMNGVLAALLARGGYDSSLEIIEGKLGFCRIYSDQSRPEALIEALGTRWEITRNGYKPYACGIVLHPPIDAVIALRERHSIDPQQVSAIELRVHRHVLSVTGTPEPATGLQSKFSINHSAAVALVDGAARIAQYTDQRVIDPALVALRRKVKVTVDESFHKGEAYARITAGERSYEIKIDHATGTAQNPMTDAQIEAKFIANAQPVIGEARARQAAAMAWKLDQVQDAGELVRLCA